jgi:hypothetical protein
MSYLLHIIYRIQLEFYLNKDRIFVADTGLNAMLNITEESDQKRPK